MSDTKADTGNTPEAVKVAMDVLETALNAVEVGKNGISTVDATAIQMRLETLRVLVGRRIREATKGEAPSLSEAGEIMGPKAYMGPVQVQKAWGVDISAENIPPIPFSREELERAKELGQFLILRVDGLSEGAKASMEQMYGQMTKKFEDESKGKVLYDTGWYKNEDFFTGDSVRFAWALQSKSVLLDSTNEDYLKQTEVRAQYLSDEVFRGQKLPEEYQAALAELEANKGEIRRLLDAKNDRVANRRLASLQINQLLSRLPAETIYDFITLYLNTGERILPNVYDRSVRLSSHGILVAVGNCDEHGAYVSYSDARNATPSIGVSLSRSQ